MDARLFGKSMVSKDVQYSKAELPIVVTPSGILTDANEKQSSKVRV